MDVYLHQRYYRINEILMTSIGQWPYQTARASRSFLVLLIFLYTIQISPQIMAMIKFRHDPEIFLECVSPLIFDAMCVVKLITCMLNSKKLLKLLNRIGEDWKVWSGDREVRILHEYAETGRKITIMYTVMIYSTGIIFMAQPILPKIINVLFYNGTEPGEFPVPVYYYHLDEQKYYFHIIGLAYVCISMIIITTIAGDTIFIVLVQHCCGIFAALGHRLEQIGETERSVDGRDTDYEMIAACIDRHNDAIEFAKLIEAIYSGCFFLVVGFNMLMMSVTALQIVMRTNDPQDTVRYIAFVCAQMIHLYIESYISQILMEHSMSIRDYIHNGKWYRVSLKAQKLLNLMILRCNVPCKLTAGKVCVMSVETFGAVVKTSVSYFTLLRSMQ